RPWLRRQIRQVRLLPWPHIHHGYAQYQEHRRIRLDFEASQQDEEVSRIADPANRLRTQRMYPGAHLLPAAQRPRRSSQETTNRRTLARTMENCTHAQGWTDIVFHCLLTSQHRHPYTGMVHRCHTV